HPTSSGLDGFSNRRRWAVPARLRVFRAAGVDDRPLAGTRWLLAKLGIGPRTQAVVFVSKLGRAQV
ncbi:MAG: hypothetical protein JWR37_2085, partial [Mycobacterium sp.]|nr:hypothetical protein [Mycobacterium sp.]